MSLEEVIDRAVISRQTLEIEYCTRNGNFFTCEITNIGYSNYYGGGYIEAYRSVNGHAFSRIFWNQYGMCS